MILARPLSALSPDLLRRRFEQDVLAGLAAAPKAVPAKHLYDARGSELFERICDLPEYYPTRTEAAILASSMGEIADYLGTDCAVIEPGSGSSFKTRMLLRGMRDPAAYIAIDISSDALESAAEGLRREFPRLRLESVWADFMAVEGLAGLGQIGSQRAVFFPGSTIGNYEPDQAADLLASFGRWVDRGGRLVLGLDLEKEASIIWRAYNDAGGLTAAFNLNLLARINRELGGDFDLRLFRHEAPYWPERSRVEMHLVSLQEQRVTVAGEVFEFQRGETIHTENSYKHRLVEFSAILRASGWKLDRLWTDDRGWFAILGLSCCAPKRGGRL